MVFLTGSSLLAPQVNAAEATFGLVRLNRMKAQAVATGGTVCLKPSASDTSVTTISVSFAGGGTGFTLGADALFAATVTDMPVFGGTTATPFPGINTIEPVVASQTITYTVASTSLTAGTVYCFNFGAGLTPSTSPASDLTGNITTNGTPGEVAVYALATISEDQIGVSATVPQIFNFSLPDTTVTLGNLSTSSVTSDNITATIGTNAKNGWVSWIRNSTNGLYSTSQSSGISGGAYPTVRDLDSSTGYVLDVVPGTGSPSIDAAYDGNGTTSGGIMESTFHQIAYKATPGAADTITLNFRAKVTAIQAPSADYADTVTIAAAGEF